MTGSLAPQVIDPLCVQPRFVGKADMALIKLHKANDTGDDEGVVFINTDQIVSISAGQNVTEIHLVDGRTQWVKDTPEEVVALAKSPDS
jgi:hypothetical protein